MALTYQAIASVTVGSGGSSTIEFTGIPATYTDLLVFYSLRSDRAAQVNSSGRISFNGITTNFNFRQIIGNGSTVGTSETGTGALIYCPASTATSSTFGNSYVYIPNYAGSTNKPYFVDFTAETNAVNIDGQGFTAGLWSNTSAITAIRITEANSANFVQHSSATLYGIKNTV